MPVSIDRPPKKFFYKILRRVKKEYPHLSLKRQMAISASIYWKMKKSKRMALRRKYAKSEITTPLGGRISVVH